MTRPLRFTVATLIALTLPALALAQRPADKANDRGSSVGSLSGKEIYQRTLKSTVWVLRGETFTENGSTGIRVTSSGSGALIDVPNRLVLTNYHVVRDNDLAIVFFPTFDKQGQPVAERDFYRKQFQQRGGYHSKVIARDPKLDLALIQLPALPAGVQALRLAKDGAVPGDSVHSIGNPGASGALWAYTAGFVKSVYKKQFTTSGRADEEPFRINARVVETTSPVNAGDSGGPVVNGSGELVAVTQGHLAEEAARSISIFIDVSEVKELLKANKFGKLVTQPSVITASSPEPKKTEEPKAPALSPAEKAEKDAASKLALAQLLVKDRPDKARERLEEIVKTYPDTQAAKEAKELLAKLKK